MTSSDALHPHKRWAPAHRERPGVGGRVKKTAAEAVFETGKTGPVNR
jgi:hypothetical protein